jgi:glycine/D-amino acid oxidase-like deaminating enzyme
MQSVVVIGGGIVGTSVAYHLSRRDGVSVRLFETGGALGTKTTGKSSIGLRQYGSDETQLRMKRYGKRLYNEFMAESSELNYNPIEVVHVATTEAGRETIEGTQASEHPLSSPSEQLEGETLRDVLVVPDLREASIELALYRPNAGYFLSPESLVHAFADRAEAAGTTVTVGTEVTDVVLEDGRVAGVVADDARYEADAVVAAAGPWNNAVTAMAGVDVPVRQQRLDILELEPTTELARQLPKIRHVETGTTFRGRPDGRVLAYRSEPAADPYAAGEDHDPDGATSVPESVKLTVLESAEELLPTLADAEIAYEDVAYTSRTPDGNPIVGWTERPGFSVAALHSRGIQYAPAIGDIITRQLVDGDPTPHYAGVSIDRFDGYTDDR